MKVLFAVAILLSIKPEISGDYSNEMNQRLSINSNHSFHYESSFSIATEWATGNWELSNDTLILSIVHIKDTIIETDSLVLSIDNVPSAISLEEYRSNQYVYPRQSASIEQKKYLVRQNTLIPIIDSNAIRRIKFEGKWTSTVFKKN